MRGVVITLGLSVLLVAAAPACPEEIAPEERAFVGWEAVRPEVFAGQALRLRLRVGFERAFFDAHAVGLVRRKLDAPLQVDVPWFSLPEGGRRLADPAGRRGREPPRMSFVLDGKVVRAWRGQDETRGGRTFAILNIDRRFLVGGPGTLHVPAARLRFAYAERFEEDFVGERVGLDPRFVSVAGQALDLVVRPLPEEGRPEAFDGAVGSYSVEARTEAKRVEVGEAFTLTVAFLGHGNLEALPTPALHGLEGFRVQGSRDDRKPYVRTVVYEVVPVRGGLDEVPPIRFAYFDPGRRPGAFGEARTKPLPLVVPEVAGAGVDAPKPGPADAPTWPYGLVGAIVAALAVLALRRRPRTVREACVAAAAPAPLPVGADDRALAAWLAARLGCSPAALVGPGLAGRLIAAGVGADVAVRTAAGMEDLVAARYGGAAAALDPALAGALEAAFASRAAVKGR